MIGRDCECFLEGGGCFDHGGYEAGGDVPFDVAVEEPDAWDMLALDLFVEGVGETCLDCRRGIAVRCYRSVGP